MHVIVGGYPVFLHVFPFDLQIYAVYPQQDDCHPDVNVMIRTDDEVVMVMLLPSPIWPKKKHKLRGFPKKDARFLKIKDIANLLRAA